MEDKNVWEVIVSLATVLQYFPFHHNTTFSCHIKQLLLSDNLWMVAVTVLPGPGIQVRVMVQRIQQQHHKQFPYLTAVGPITCISAPHPRARDLGQSDWPKDPAAESQTAPHLTPVGPNTSILARRPRARDAGQSDGPEDPAAASQTDS
jgi:hypothetical protein